MITFAPLPHAEAVARTAGLPLVTREVMEELLPELKAYAFCITGVDAFDQLARARDLIAAVPAGQKTWDQAKKDLAAELEGPLGEGAERRAELLLRTHTFRGYAASRYRTLMAQREVFPLWQYKTHGDGNVRLSHAALNGKIFPAGHPIWQRIFPPWDWGCRCLVVGLMEDDVAPEEMERLRIARDAEVGARDLGEEAMASAKTKLGSLSRAEKLRLAQEQWDAIRAANAARTSGKGEAIPAAPAGMAGRVSTVPDSKVEELARINLYQKERDRLWKERLKTPQGETKEEKAGSLLETQRYTAHLYTAAEADAMHAAGRLYLPNGQTVSLMPSQTWGDSPWSVPGTVQHTWAMIRERYAKDPEVLAKFEAWARATKIEGNLTVADWLSGSAAVTKVKKAVKKAKKAAKKDTFPGDLSTLKLVRKLGGSTGAELVQAEDGALYVRKRGDSPDHIREEDHADSVYRALGVAVPESRLYDSPQGPTKLARHIAGQTLAEWLQTASASDAAAMRARLQEGFPADVLLGNWDVIGLQSDNIIVDGDGTPWRVDNGGSLRFRAQGARKTPEQWTPYATELWTMRDPRVSSSAASVFGGLDYYRLAARLEQLNPMALPAGLPADLRATLAQRMGHLADIGRKGLEMQRDKWRPDYASELARHMMGLRQAGIVARMPKKLSSPPGDFHLEDDRGVKYGNLRAKPGQRSLVEDLADYINGNGGAYQALIDYKFAHAENSWDEDAVAYKHYLSKQTDLPASSWWWERRTRDQGAAAYAKLAARLSKQGSVDIAFAAHHAFVQELLAATDLPYNDRRRRVMRLLRTEHISVMQAAGLRPGDRGVTLSRGVNESFSLLHKIGIYGDQLTVQAVPHSRITALYIPETIPGRGGSGFLGDYESEVNAVTSDLPFDYVDKDPLDNREQDATQWGLTP
ncbi:MAG: phage minor head protein [Roseimicrobium sp.]